MVGAGSSAPGWGIGKATAVLFAREGANVLACDVNAAAAQETVQLIRSEGGTAESYVADVRRAGRPSGRERLARGGRERNPVASNAPRSRRTPARISSALKPP